MAGAAMSQPGGHPDTAREAVGAGHSHRSLDCKPRGTRSPGSRAERTKICASGAARRLLPEPKKARA